MTQLSLLSSRAPASIAEARRRRDIGMARSDRDIAFAALADAAILRLARERAEFIVDDVWPYMPEDARGRVDGRAMGSAITRAVRAGTITGTDRYRPSAQPSCHANPRRVWRSQVHR